MLEKTPESPLDSKEIKPVNPKGNQPWILIGRTDAKTEAPVLCPPDAKSWLIGKDPDAGKEWRREEKGMTEDEMVGWHHRLNRHEFEQTQGDGEGQGSLGFFSPWGPESDMTEWLNNNNNMYILNKKLPETVRDYSQVTNTWSPICWCLAAEPAAVLQKIVTSVLLCLLSVHTQPRTWLPDVPSVRLEVCWCAPGTQPTWCAGVQWGPGQRSVSTRSWAGSPAGLTWVGLCSRQAGVLEIWTGGGLRETRSRQYRAGQSAAHIVPKTDPRGQHWTGELRGPGAGGVWLLEAASVCRALGAELVEQKEIEGCLQSSRLEGKRCQHSCGLRPKLGYVNTLVNMLVPGLHPGPSGAWLLSLNQCQSLPLPSPMGGRPYSTLNCTCQAQSLAHYKFLV